MTPEDWRDDAPAYLAAAAAVMTVVSIAASQILMGLAVAVFLASRRRIAWPPVTWPLAAWMLLTVLSLAASGHVREGLPQIKKFYVFLMLFLIASALRGLRDIRAIAFGWAAAAALSAAWSMEQFARKVQQARHDHIEFYVSYVGNRITGFMSHWMTFSGQMMIAILIAGALLLFSRDRRGLAWLIPAGVLIGTGLLAAETRSMWGAAAAGGAYLLWIRRPWLVLAIPLMVGIVFVANPFQMRDRMISVVRPHGDRDSNEHRDVLRRVGWEMIKAHPLLGVGPEQVGPQFHDYLPADIPRPLPTGYYEHLHNIYFHYAAERGLPALAALLWLLGRGLYDFARALRRKHSPAEARWVLHGAIAVIVSVMLAGYFEVNLGDSEVLAMFLAVLGCGYAALSQTQPAPISPVWKHNAPASI